jgi:hypothetical protein
MWMRSPVSKCGCAFSSVTRPWVAQRVWPIPVVGSRSTTATPPPARSATASRRKERLPTARTDSIWSPESRETPAES